MTYQEIDWAVNGLLIAFPQGIKVGQYKQVVQGLVMGMNQFMVWREASASAMGIPSGEPKTNKRTRRPNGERRKERGDVSKFSLGQKVLFNVGRGKDTGVITKIDHKTNSAYVKRDSNKRIVKRPARGLRVP